MKNKGLLLLLALSTLFACGQVSSSSSARPSTSTRPFASSIDYDLVETNIADFNFEKVTGGYAVTRYTYKSKTTTRVVIPETFEGEPVVQINDGAFVYASGVKKVIIPHTVKTIQNGAFLSCSSIESLEVLDGNLNYSSSEGALYDKTGETFLFCPEAIKTITIPTTVKHLADNAFYRSTIQEVTLSEGLLTIGDRCFSYTKNLSKIVIPNTVTEIGESVFEYAKGLKEVTLSTSMAVLPKLTFSQCPLIKEINVPGNIKVIEEQAITDNDYLTKVTFNEGVESIGEWSVIRNTFLKEVVVPTSLRTIADYAFNSNDHLTTIELKEGLKSIGIDAFSLCPTLTNLYIPSTVTSIGEGFVAYNKKLATIEVSEDNQSYKDDNGVLYTKDGKTLIAYPSNREGYSYNVLPTTEVIAREAITYCVRLSYVDEQEGIDGRLTLPSSIKEIGVKAFAYSSYVSKIYYEGSMADFNNVVTSWKIDGETYSAFSDSNVKKISCGNGEISL